jgi:hypothetical protein
MMAAQSFVEVPTTPEPPDSTTEPRVLVAVLVAVVTDVSELTALAGGRGAY